MNEEMCHILVIEDEHAHATLIRYAFADSADRFCLTVVHNLDEARACLDGGIWPDLVISDLLLPDGRGIELLPIADGGRSFPLVLMTSHGDENMAAEAIQAGALDYVVKSATTLADLPRIAERALSTWARIEPQRNTAPGALRKSEQRLRNVLDNSRDVIYKLNLSPLAYQYISPSALSLFGFTPAEIIALGFNELVERYHPEDRQRLRPHLDSILEGYVQADAPPTIEYRWRHKDGAYRWISESLALVYDDDGRLQAIVGSLRDVSAQVQAQAEREALIKELESKNAALERFASAVSHNLKSPLLIISGLLRFLEQDALAGNVAGVQANQASIANAAAQVNRLVDELLEFSRVGQLLDPPGNAPLDELARELVDVLGDQPDAHNVQAEIAPDLLQPDGPTIYGDRLRLLEVLEYLVDNAVKFLGDQPDPRVEIGARRNGTETIFYVRDNGAGIAPQYHDRVFGLFEKLDAETEGAGIGLTIVKRIVEVHGGRVWIESSAGQGDTFCFALSDNSEAARKE